MDVKIFGSNGKTPAKVFDDGAIATRNVNESGGAAAGLTTEAVENLEGAERDWSFDTYTAGASGNTPADAKALAFQSTGAANTIDGKTLPDPFSFGVSVDFPDTLAQKAYVVGAGGTLTIVYVLS